MTYGWPEAVNCCLSKGTYWSVFAVPWKGCRLTLTWSLPVFFLLLWPRALSFLRLRLLSCLVFCFRHLHYSLLCIDVVHNLPPQLSCLVLLVVLRWLTPVVCLVLLVLKKEEGCQRFAPLERVVYLTEANRHLGVFYQIN